MDQAITALGPGDPTQLGEWKLVGRLGAGGMGTVYLGRKGDRTAAVKAIAPALADSPDFRARFRREIVVCRRVSGTQVAELYDADPDAPQPWLAVRYVPGPTLDRAVHAHGPLSGQTLDGFALAVVEAVRQIHAAGVTHRDLKPSNVILTADTPVLIDFGIAGVADATALTATGTSMGSAGWMAPEQILGHSTGAATDVFAWGAVVAYASSGLPPFGFGRPESLTYRVVHGSPDLERVPDRYQRLVAQALLVDPDARPTVPQLLAELSGDLKPTQIAGAIAATWAGDDATRFATAVVPPSVAEQRPAPARRWRVPALVAAVAAVLAIGGVALFLGTRDQDQEAVAAAEITTPETRPVTSSAPPPTEVVTTTKTPTTVAETTTTAPTAIPEPTTTTEDRFPTALAPDRRPVDIPLGHARVGDCLNEERGQRWALSEYVTRIPCGITHDLEVTKHVRLDFDRNPYPGSNALYGVIEPACVQSFEDYVGAPIGTEFVSITLIAPGELEWSGGFIEGMCLLEGTEGEPLIGSKKDLRG